MGAVVERQDARPDAWIGRVVGPGMGVVAAAAVVGLASWEGRLRDQLAREPSAEPIWVWIGLHVLAGVATAVAVLVSRRMPWLPTVAAVTLGYHLLASVPSGWATALPYPDLVPRLHWGFTTVALITGVMAATAVWSWRSHLGRPAQR